MIIWIVFITLIAILSVIIVEQISKNYKLSDLQLLYMKVLKELTYDRDNIWNKGLFNHHGICRKIINLKEDGFISGEEYDLLMSNFHSQKINWITLSTRDMEGGLWVGYAWACTKEGNLQRIEFIKNLLKTI